MLCKSIKSDLYDTSFPNSECEGRRVLGYFERQVSFLHSQPGMIQKHNHSSSERIIVFSDLDGSLLDHETYDYAPAQEALDRLRSLDIPLVLATSKTLEEVLDLMEDLDLVAPFIIENGGALVIPEDYFVHGGGAQESYDEIPLSVGVDKLKSWLTAVQEQQGYSFRTMLDMSVLEVMDYTGLESGEAERAMMRRYTIPMVWQDSDERLDDFGRRVREHGWSLLRGGRFIHLQGQTDKARAMQECVRCFKSQGQDRSITIALGDSENDRGMLEAADYAIVIRRSSGGCLQLTRDEEVYIPRQPGPTGWNEGLLHVLDKIQV
jgi:mannosyl-3-phosphoglycerate phosphatase